jgi:hypothetical protein
MERKDIVKKLISILQGIQDDAGEDVEAIIETTCPIGGMKGFDSLRGVCATVKCVEEFNLEDDKIVSLFEGKKNGIPCALTVAEIADKIKAMTN